MSVVSKKVAEKDFEKFLTAFRLDPIKRRKISIVNERTGKSIIAPILELIEEGMLIVKDNGDLEYPLLDKILNESGVVFLDRITFKPKRVSVDQIKEVEKIELDSEGFMKILHFLTGVEELIMGKFSNDDISYLSRVAMVFM